jgi:hypothetical protein
VIGAPDAVRYRKAMIMTCFNSVRTDPESPWVPRLEIVDWGPDDCIDISLGAGEAGVDMFQTIVPDPRNCTLLDQERPDAGVFWQTLRMLRVVTGSRCMVLSVRLHHEEADYDHDCDDLCPAELRDMRVLKMVEDLADEILTRFPGLRLWIETPGRDTYFASWAKQDRVFP